MITLHGIPNTKQFIQAVDQCGGRVIAEFPGHKTYDLKSSSLIRRELSSFKSGYQGNILLHLENTQDTIHMIDYMAQSYCDTSAIRI